MSLEIDTAAMPVMKRPIYGVIEINTINSINILILHDP
jgi:hypothetical protein